MGNEWTRLAVITYVKDIAFHERNIDLLMDDCEELRLKMERIGAIRYDRDGSPAGWSDPMAAMIDDMDMRVDRLASEYALWKERIEEGHRIFRQCDETMMVWEHWGERKRWADVAKRRCYNRNYIRQLANRGIEIIWHMMPEEYRRSPYPAVPWSVK